MARARQAPSPDPDEEFVPPYYRAVQDIYLGHPDSGAMPVAAFRRGDPVPADIAENHRLGGQVEVPAEFEGGLPVPPEPEVPEAETDGESPPSADALPDAG